MTESMKCTQCGQLLYFGEEIKRRLYMRAIADEKAVLSAYGHTCPRCTAPLSKDTVSTEIKRRVRHGA